MYKFEKCKNSKKNEIWKMLKFEKNVQIRKMYKFEKCWNLKKYFEKCWNLYILKKPNRPEKTSEKKGRKPNRKTCRSETEKTRKKG